MKSVSLPRWIFLVLLIALVLLLVPNLPLSTSSALEAQQPDGGGGTPASPVQSLPDKPAFDARALLDRRRALQMDLQPADPEQAAAPAAALQNSMRDQAGAPLQAAGDTRVAPAATRTATALNPETVQPNIPRQTEALTGCTPLIFNPSLDYGSGWFEYDPVVYVADDVYYTYPSSFNLFEDDDGFGYTDGDLDSFGQPFTFPADANSLIIEFNIAYGDFSADDIIYYSFYYANPDGSLGDYIASGFPAKFGDGQWHFVRDDSVTADSGIIDLIRGQDIAIVFEMYGDNTGAPMDVYVDDVDIRACTDDIPPTGMISGTISEGGTNTGLGDVFLFLLKIDRQTGDFIDVLDLTLPFDDGSYTFYNVGGLAANEAYQIWYINDEDNPNRLDLWAGSLINNFTNGQNLTGVDFDIGDVTLLKPDHDALVTFPTTFMWANRGVAGDQYLVCLYDLDTLDEACTRNSTTSNSMTVNLADFDLSQFDFRFDRRYGWYITLLGATYDPNAPAFAEVGYSYGAHAITFSEEEFEVPTDSPDPSGSPPTSGGTADWTVMVYIAGDNNLGDPARYLNPTLNLQGQYAVLKQLAQDYPRINIVALTDFFDESGTQFCHLKPDGTQDCQQLGEQDTSDPQTLSNFINNTLDNFDANHTMLIISDHGHAIGGVAVDETTSRTASMTPDEIRQAFSSASLDNANRKLDILFYNVCLMGNFAVAFDASSYADYMVASANELWILSVYERLLPVLNNNPNNPKAAAAGIPQAYKASVDQVAPGFFVSSAAYNLAKVNNVNAALSNLAQALNNNLSVDRPILESLRNQHVQLYDSSGNLTLGDEDAFVDLYHLALLLRNNTSLSDPVRSAAANLVNALGTPGLPNSFIFSTQQISGSNGQGGTHNLNNASGLSVYFPTGSNRGNQPTLTNSYLNQSTFQTYNNQTSYDEFLRVYISGALSSGPGGIASGPGGIASGVQPIFATVPDTNTTAYLPLIRR